MSADKEAVLQVKGYQHDRGYAVTILSIILIAVFAPYPALFPWAIALLGLTLGLLPISFLKEEDRAFLFKIFFYGYLSRVLVACILHLATMRYERNPGFLIDDGWTYSVNGWAIANKLERGLPIDTESVRSISVTNTVNLYDYINGWIYFIVGYNPLTVFFLNCFLGAVTPLFLYFMTRSIFNRSAARLTAILCGFWPSIFLWSTQNLKEPLNVFLVVVCFWAFILFLKRINPFYLAIGGFALYALLRLRSIVAGIIVISVILQLLFLIIRLIKRWPVLFLAMIPIFVIAAINSNHIIEQYMSLIQNSGMDVSSIARTTGELRKARASHSLAILPDYEIVDFRSLIVYLPVGLIAVLFAPFPWQVFSVSQMMAGPEMLVWYLMFSNTAKGAWFALKKKSEYTVCIFAYIMMILMILGAIEGNAGTIFRHRSIAMVFLLMFMAVGIDMKEKRGVQYACKDE